MSDLNNFWSGFGCHTRTHSHTQHLSSCAESMRACASILSASRCALQVLCGFAPHKRARAHSRINCSEGRANAAEHTHAMRNCDPRCT